MTPKGNTVQKQNACKITINFNFVVAKDFIKTQGRTAPSAQHITKVGHSPLPKGRNKGQQFLLFPAHCKYVFTIFNSSSIQNCFTTQALISLSEQMVSGTLVHSSSSLSFGTACSLQQLVLLYAYISSAGILCFILIRSCFFKKNISCS